MDPTVNAERLETTLSVLANRVIKEFHPSVDPNVFRTRSVLLLRLAQTSSAEILVLAHVAKTHNAESSIITHSACVLRVTPETL